MKSSMIENLKVYFVPGTNHQQKFFTNFDTHAAFTRTALGSQTAVTVY